VFAPVAGYADPIEVKPVNNEPVDTSWNNLTNTIRATKGGVLAPGQRPNTNGGDGTPGKLTVNGSVYLYGATFTVYAKGAKTQGTDYSWLASGGQVSLGNSKLDVSLINYNPNSGDKLTIITAKGITGKFSQGDSITVGSFKFTITYNATSVVLTRASLVSQPPVAHLYQALLKRDAGPAELSYWNNQIDQGATRLTVAQSIYDSAEHRGLQVDDYYQEFLNRPSDPQGRAGWVSAFEAGKSEADVQAGFLSSSEYLHQHPDPASIVNGIFGDILGRAPTTADLAFWVNVAKSSAGASGVALGLLDSTEADTLEVTHDYEDFLGRAPDTDGLNMWLALLAQKKVTTEQVALGILTSDEFFGVG
jgi:hypothetical protein